jgi:hypothetical protein
VNRIGIWRWIVEETVISTLKEIAANRNGSRTEKGRKRRIEQKTEAEKRARI